MPNGYVYFESEAYKGSREVFLYKMKILTSDMNMIDRLLDAINAVKTRFISEEDYEECKVDETRVDIGHINERAIMAELQCKTKI